MKCIYYLLFGLLSTCKIHGQDCKSLEKKSFFTSIKFGKQIPADLITCSKKRITEYPYNGTFRVEYDSLQQGCKKRYADLFTFRPIPFSFLQVSTNKKGQIFSVEMYSFFNDNRFGDSITYQPPPDFTRLYNQLESAYGKPTNKEVPAKMDSLFIKEKGFLKQFDWYCNNMHLQLRMIYGARQKMLNLLHIQIRDRDLEFPLELEERLQ